VTVSKKLNIKCDSSGVEKFHGGVTGQSMAGGSKNRNPWNPPKFTKSSVFYRL